MNTFLHLTSLARGATGMIGDSKSIPLLLVCVNIPLSGHPQSSLRSANDRTMFVLHLQVARATRGALPNDLFPSRKMAKESPKFDDSLVRQAQSTDNNSPITYVRQFLGRRLSAHLVDGTRQVIGIFTALDSAGQMTMTKAMEVEANGRHRDLGIVIVGLNWICKLEERPAE
jgi:hypothetical protein